MNEPSAATMTSKRDAEAAVPAIDVRGLTYRYPDGREALRGVEFAIGAGECAALVGPNGAGKSTLLWHLNGLLPERLDRHNSPIRIDGLAVTTANAPEIRRRVGLLFQDPDDQLFSESVIADVAFGPLNLGKSKADARAIALDALRRVDLLEQADRPPHHLSLGERKRACLAGVLACAPSVLVLDEPSANLDPRGRRRLMQLIRDLPGTKLIATHDLELVLELCGRAVLMDEGKVVAIGPSKDLLGDAALMEAHGLELPASLRR